MAKGEMEGNLHKTKGGGKVIIQSREGPGEKYEGGGTLQGSREYNALGIHSVQQFALLLKH